MKKPALPSVPKARFSDPAQQRYADSVQSLAEVLTGRKGNGLDRAVLVRDLRDAGLVTLKKTAGGGVDVGGGNTGGTNPDDEVVTQPPRPKGLRATGAFTSILLTWDQPKYAPASAAAHTEVWRGETNVLGQAKMIAKTEALLYGDPVSTGSRYYYWVRHVNVGAMGNTNYGAFSPDGLLAETSPDISNVIDDVTEQMRDSPLVNELFADIDGVDADIRHTSSVVSQMQSNGSFAHQALWNVKAQAGDIKAGIGILADSSGKSQVAVAASQFFVFDPNQPYDQLTPVFAIDKGNVIIPSALIETATIQILNAQTITADEVRAGISMTAPQINGGRINGAELNIGEGGGYNGHYFHVNAHGSLYAQNAIVRGNIVADEMTINALNVVDTLNVRGGAITSAEWSGVVGLGSSQCDLWSEVVDGEAVIMHVSFAGYHDRNPGDMDAIFEVWYHLKSGPIIHHAVCKHHLYTGTLQSYTRKLPAQSGNYTLQARIRLVKHNSEVLLPGVCEASLTKHGGKR